MRYVLAMIDSGHWFYNNGTRTGWGTEIDSAKLWDDIREAEVQRNLLPDSNNEVHILPVHTIVDHNPIKT